MKTNYLIKIFGILILIPALCSCERPSGFKKLKYPSYFQCMCPGTGHLEGIKDYEKKLDFLSGTNQSDNGTSNTNLLVNQNDIDTLIAQLTACSNSSTLSGNVEGDVVLGRAVFESKDSPEIGKIKAWRKDLDLTYQFKYKALVGGSNMNTHTGYYLIFLPKVYYNVKAKIELDEKQNPLNIGGNDRIMEVEGIAR